jgi:uncharacterized protein
MEQQGCFDQSDVFTFLADPATHELREPVIRIDTHGAAVFLAGKNVYKVKRAVRFPFMDFSTLDKRRRACERELAVNKADAPGLYLGVVPISKDGFHLNFGGEGTIVEWAVHLRRFDENRTASRAKRAQSRNHRQTGGRCRRVAPARADHQRRKCWPGIATSD